MDKKFILLTLAKSCCGIRGIKHFGDPPPLSLSLSVTHWSVAHSRTSVRWRCSSSWRCVSCRNPRWWESGGRGWKETPGSTNTWWKTSCPPPASERAWRHFLSPVNVVTARHSALTFGVRHSPRFTSRLIFPSFICAFLYLCRILFCKVFIW